MVCCVYVFFFKQKTAYEMRISDWSSDVCSSDLVRHESFACAEFVELARALGVAIVEAYHDSYPLIAEATADFAYLRLQQSREEEPTGYSDAVLEDWEDKARAIAMARAMFLLLLRGAKVSTRAAAEPLNSSPPGGPP